ncbi:daf-12-interacting protein 1-like isoform X2 [Mercenaria mercenaria]|uniref:daf-12-interacting protein 1-like isoform X2 n=1 Tax=Mercenaria mercenaria TaxID=6596 RepID=UPI00234F56B4|nr:daf-12-interacting protein 1-like isoform X2 [Mercenaria mercenaria]
MACRYREELVGKRFISVRSPQKLKIQKISEWEWRSGVVRAVSSKDSSSLDLSVLIEFDDIDWTRREWVRVHDIFQLFLVEHTLVWAERPDPDKPRQSLSWPGLSFRAVVDKAGLAGCKRKPVEFLVDRFLGLVEEKEIQIFQEGDENTHPTAFVRREVQHSLKEWLDYQDGQKILLTTPTVLVGYRLEVYRAEGTTQWYTAVIQSYNHTSKTLSVTDDTVLEEHNEDPTLIQMHLIDDGVVDSILRGVEIGGIAPRRRPRAVKQEKEQQNSSTTRTSSSSVTHTTTSSRCLLPPKKSRTSLQSPAPTSTPAITSSITAIASPSLDVSARTEIKGLDKTSVKQKTSNSKDRKRRVEAQVVSENLTSKRKTKPQTHNKTDLVNTQVSDSDSNHPVRVSPRNTPAKERIRPQRNRERDKESEELGEKSVENNKKDSAKETSEVKSDTESLQSKPKTPARSRQKKDDKVELPSLRRTDSPRNRTESPRGTSNSPRRRSLSRTPVETEAESVIKPNSGSCKKDKKAEKSDRKVNSSAKTDKSDLKSDLNTPQPVTENPSSTKAKQKDNVNSEKDSKNLVEEKVKEIKSALKKKEKESGNAISGELKERKSPRKACQEKEVKRKEKKKDNENSQVKTTDSKKSVDAEKGNCIEKEKTSLNESGDNMHYIKKKQSLLAGGASSGTPQNSGIPTSIDFNQSVTDQIARAGKLSSFNGDEKAGSVPSTLSSPTSDRECENQSLPRDNKHSVGSLNSSLQNTNTNSSWSQDERCLSRNSDSRCSSGLSGDEAHRPSSRVDDLKSSKSSTASSPLIVDKSEPVQIYRDPELMSKNPVRSNVPSMHNPHKSYPQVHNPIPTQASRPASVGMTSSVPLSSAMERTSRTPVIPSVAYPSPLQMGPSIPGASLSSLLPPGLHQLDPATLAIHQQIAAVQQQQLAALAASEQYRNALSMSYPPPRGSMNKSQLEHLWQQKYPSVPVPPPWLLAKHQDDLVREARILHEQQEQHLVERERLERIERERERDLREQRERKERERRERERMEKERLDRERREREKVEQERIERERLEREKQEKDRQEREHRERLERERRILKESVDSHAAVDQHFSESLRLASQRAAQTGMWPQPSITLGTGKPKPDPQHPSSKMGELKPEEKIKQEQLRETDFHYAEMMRKHQELMSQQEEYIRYQKMLSAGDHKSDIKQEMRKEMGSAPYERHSIKREPGSSTNVKQEVQANFSLYGYKPEKYSFITTDQLQSYELEKIKGEKGVLDSKLNRSQSPRKKDLSVPPPLIKDSKPYSSVIVENKTKDGSLKSASPQYTSHMSPHHQPKPAHTPERPHSSSSSPGSHGMNPMTAHSQQLAALRADAVRQGTSRSQSPLRIASPQQLSAAVMEPMDYRCSPNVSKTRGSPGSNPVSHPSSVNSSGSYSPAIAQPPVSLPHSSVPYTYSLIQQGLVPNPIYSNNSNGKGGDSQRTVSVTGTAQVPRAAQSPHSSYREQMQQHSAMGSKRKGQKEGNSRKRQKGSEVQSHSPTASSNNNPLNLSVPCTTPQIVSNQSPYTTSSGSVLSSAMSTTQAGTATTTSSQAVIKNRLHGLTGFMDSFKSFVENTVQNAFMSDPELGKPKEGQIKKPPSADNLRDLHQQHLQQQLTHKPQPYKPKSSLERSSTPVTSQQSAQNEESNLSNSGNSNSAMSYVESINRVANGQIDTDSDTLSAPSPPPHLKQENTPSPHKAAKHPNLKKAWLQRHSDEDKQESQPQDPVTGPAVVADGGNVNQNNPSGDLEKDKEVKNCYVNCSYISPGKDGSKSPISAILPNGNLDKSETNDSSTTSASETETQATDSGVSNPRKRVKNKKERTVNPKKAKIDSDESSSASTTGQGKKKTSRRSKESKTKNNADNMSEEQIKKIVENCRESVKEKDPKQTEEAYDKTLDSEDATEQKTEQTDIETEEPQDAESSRKSDRKEKKKNKEKKDKKNKKEKEKQLKEPKEKEQEKSEEEEVETEPVYVPPPSMFKDAETKVQQSTVIKELVRVPDSVLRKTCEPFLQDGSCSEVTPKLMKCRECKMTPTQRGKTVPNIFCRFYAFRRLKYSQRGFVTIDGFSELSDADQDDIDPWIPKSPIIEPKIDVESARFIIRRLGDKFCELIQQEKEAHICAGENAKIAWKRAVTGVREMCDVCDTTLFNMHWVCHKCGFVVCLDCYKVKAKEVEGDEDSDNGGNKMEDEDQRQWLTCSANRQAHDVDKLMLTQIIPADALWEVGRMVHEVRDRFQILRACPCSPKINTKKNGIRTDLMNEAIKHLSPKKKLVNGVGGEEKSKTKNGNIKNAVYNPDSTSPLSLLADVASMDSEKTRDRSESPLLSKKKDGKNGKSYNPITEPVSPGSSEKKMPPSCSTLRELLTKTAGSKVKNNSESKKKSKNTSSLNDIIQKVVEKHIPKEMEKNGPLNTVTADEPEIKLLHYKPRFGASHILVRETPIIAHNLTETSVLYPDVPHSWLCDGRLLRLHDPRHKGNLRIFMEQWKRGQPVLVSGVDKYVNGDLWKPAYFSKHFGEFENDLINCRTSCLVVNQPMKHFWDGFSCLEERLVDEEGTPMLLKLKDWPPGDDFSDILPQQFNDLMHALPLPEYTKRDGRLNLVSRLPDFLVKPDLGPKMYIAYGSAQYPKEGTTNLHLDVSDATNVMVYVGYLEDEERGRIPKDQETNKAIEMARCDPITKRRIREVRETPGALWHIFDAVDADKIRDFLNKVGKERGEKIEQHHDPIHDQSWYLDEELRDRLAKEYNVLGYTILQCLGDAIFVPAGAPHQVRNLNNCIKVAEDFVSPENVHHCFQLTQEFRHLSAGHSNHEDKLQIKNIVYHAIKDATAVLNDASPEDLED